MILFIRFIIYKQLKIYEFTTAFHNRQINIDIMYKSYEQKTVTNIPLNNDMLFQALSELLILTKKNFIAFQKSITLQSRGDIQFMPSLFKLKEIHSEQSTLLAALPILLSKHNNQMDINRFIARVIEIFGVFRHKYQQVGGYQSMVKYINQLQQSINQYTLDRNASRVLNKCNKVSEKFRKKLELSEQNYLQKNNNVQSQDKLEKDGNNIQEILIGKNSQQSMPLSKQINSKSEHFLNRQLAKQQRLLSTVNKSFLTLSLDIDLSHFRTSYLRVRNSQNTQELKEQILERNQFILREINRYSKDFKNYLERRQIKKQNIRKNRLHDGFNHHNASMSPNILKNDKIKQKKIICDDFLGRKISNRLKKAYTTTFLIEQIEQDDKQKKNENIIQQKNKKEHDICNQQSNSYLLNQSLYNTKYNKNCYEMKNVVIGSRVQFQFHETKNKQRRKAYKLNSTFKYPNSLFPQEIKDISKKGIISFQGRKIKESTININNGVKNKNQNLCKALRGFTREAVIKNKRKAQLNLKIQSNYTQDCNLTLENN